MNASQPFVVHLPKLRTSLVAVLQVALAVWGVYLVATWHSAFDGILGIVLLAICGPIAVILIGLLVRNEPVLTVTDAGIEAPKLGVVRWFEITSLKVDDRGLVLTTHQAVLRLSRARMDVKAMALRGEIAARSGGSWLSGQWSSRES